MILRLVRRRDTAAHKIISDNFKNAYTIYLNILSFGILKS